MRDYEKYMTGNRSVIATSADFPLYHRYSGTGQKLIRISDNLSSLCVNGRLPNGIAQQLKSVRLNRNIIEVPPSCFMNCDQLTSVNHDSNVKLVDDYAFYGCSSLEYVNFLGIQNKELMRIGDYAFANSGLKSVAINHQGSVDDSALHSYCFASCFNLESVEFTNSTYLGTHMFDGCRSLTSVTLNNYHSYVGEYCFANCSGMRRIKLPAKIYMLSPHMFDGCANLTSIELASDADLRQCGDMAFNGCSKLTSITLPASVSSFSFIDPLFLSGSSVNRIVMNGMDDEYITSVRKVSKELQYDTGVIYETDLNNILNCACEKNVPVVAWLTKGSWKDSKGRILQCAHCQNLYVNVIKPLTEWFKTTPYFYLKGDYICHNSDASALEQFMRKNELNVPGTLAYMYLYWKKSDGTVMKWTSGSINPSPTYQQTLKDKMAELFAGYEGGTEISYEIKESITTFGRGPGLSVTFVSKTGQEYVCGNDSVEHIPEEKIDKTTTDDFRYGIWYYNARQLKAYADEHNLPVLFEYSSSACDPCRDFRKSTFCNQVFQSEIKTRPCLLCRVEIGENEYFDHPTNTQAYYLSHDLNKENTYIPCLIYYWKKSDGTTYQKAWNYNYRSDPANANYQTVLAKLDEMLGDYQGEPQYWPPPMTWSDNDMFRYYANQEGDDDGRYFICDKKTPTTEYIGTLSIDLDNSQYLTAFDDGWIYPTAEGASPIQLYGQNATLTGITIGQLVDVPPYTYQYYPSGADQAQYNLSGVIFKTEPADQSNQTSVAYICLFENENQPIIGSSGEKYQTGVQYTPDSATGFQSIRDWCEDYSVTMVIVESGTAHGDFDDILSSSGFKGWLKTSGNLLVTVRSDDWLSDVGQAVRQFESEIKFTGNSISDPLPKMLVYHGCSSCTTDGSTAIYCRRKIDVVSGKDWKYYADLIDQYSNE